MIYVKRDTIRKLILFLTISIIAIFPVNSTIKLCIALLQCFFIIINAKISFFSVFTFLINFCLTQQYFAYNGSIVYGLLEYSNIPIYFDELCICTYLFNLIMYFFILFSNITEKEKGLYSVEINFNVTTSALMLLFAVVITFLIFPSFPSLSDFTVGNRFRKGIIPFTGWSIIPFFLLSVATKNDKLHKITNFCITSIVFWYALHGERVEAIGFLTFLGISYYHKHKSNKLSSAKIIFVATILVVIFIIIGILRTGSSDISLNKVIKSIIVQPTACDVTYVFNCAVDAWYNNIKLSGITYLSYLVNCVPFLNDNYSFASIIQNYYYTAGGGMFFAEPFANFGIFFTAFISIVFLFFFYFLLKKPSRYSYLLYSSLCISVFRIAWYGLNYPIITMLYFVPFTLILNKLFQRTY